MKQTKEIKNILTYLEENFTNEDYKKYIYREYHLSDIYSKFNCSDYTFRMFLKKKGYKTRQALRKSKLNETIFNKINSEESAYILGFYIADGCISDNRFIISIKEEDKYLLEKIRDYISPITKLLYVKGRRNKQGIVSHPMWTLNIPSEKLYTRLEKLGLGKNKTYIQKSVKNLIPKEYMWHFIRGYFDGDGCINYYNITKKHVTKSGEEKIYHHTNLGFTIISKDKLILDELCEFINSCGINTYVYPDTKGCFLIGTHSLTEIQKIYKLLYENSNMYLTRKKDKF